MLSNPTSVVLDKAFLASDFEVESVAPDAFGDMISSTWLNISYMLHFGLHSVTAEFHL